MFEDFSTKDLPKEYKFPVGKNTITMYRDHVFGFWKFKFERGELPEVLKGAYTSIAQAELAVQTYIKGQDKQVLA